MYVVRTRSRGLFIIRQFLSGPTLETQSIAGYSTSGRSSATPEEPVMFKKAVKDHSASSAKPLQSNLLNSNVNAPSKPPSQSIGVKRKIEMTSAGESSLGSLHNAVYFDENDFDDDDDLNFEDPDPPIPIANTTQSKTQKRESVEEDVNGPPAGLPLPRPKHSPGNDEASLEIQYPDLPPVPDDDGAPPSSIQYPWSSSPPSHFQRPSNPRTVPWLKGQEQPRVTGDSAKTVTPARPKPTAIWNKSASAIKEEQKELRRQSKKGQKAESTSKQPQSEQKLAAVFLSDEQKHVLDAVVQLGKSIFFTGSAGTGKSVLMREIIKNLRAKYRREPDRVAVTASTGLAACNIGGVTLHSFAGIGLGKEPVPELVKKVLFPFKFKKQ